MAADPITGLEIDDEEFKTPAFGQEEIAPPVVEPEPISFKQPKKSEKRPEDDTIKRLNALLKNIDKEKDQYKKDKKRETVLNFANELVGAFTTYGMQSARGKAMEAGFVPTTAAPQFKARRIKFAEKPDTDYAMKQAKLLVDLRKAETKKGIKKFQQSSYVNELGEPVTFDQQTNKYINPRTGLEEVGRIKKAVTASGRPKKFQQSDYENEQGEPVTYNPYTNEYINPRTGKAEAGKITRKVAKILKDKEGRKFRYRNDGSISYITDKPTDELYVTWDDMSEKQQDDMKGLSKEYRKAIEPINDFENTIEGMTSFVAENLDGTIGSIKRQLARTVGQEKGVMTDRDVAAFGGTDKVVEIIAQFAHAKVHGGMTKYVQNNFQKILAIAKKNISKKKITIESKYVRPAQVRLGKNANRAYVQEMLGFEVRETKRPDRSKKDEMAIKWAKQNPKDPRAIKILELHGE